MNISNLQQGMVVKNYRELCKLLEIEVKAGNSKKAQLKELNKYIKYHKDGNKFIIDEIIDIEKSISDKLDYTIEINEENILELDKEHLGNLLGVKKSGLVELENNNKVEERLLSRGYKLIEKLKHGRRVYYKIARVNADLDLYTSICNNIFNTREYENFACYFCYRMMNTHEPITRKFLSEMSWASQKTIKKWDDIMVDIGLLCKDGYFYVVREKVLDENGEKVDNIRLGCKDEYDTYRRTSRISKKLEKVKLQYLAGKIDFEEYTELISSISACWDLLEDKYMYKVNKYKLKEDNEFYDDLIDLLFNTYLKGIDESEFYVDFDPKTKTGLN